MTLILASQSVARKNMLDAAGVSYTALPADLDEDSITKNETKKGEAPQSIALTLATAKASAIAKENPDALVIGSDQILECDGKMLSKAANENQAREKLKSLRGKTHHLISAVCVAKGDSILWQAVQTANLTMHDFDDAFLDDYIKKAGIALTRSVGAYELESLGVNLFEKIEGDYFTILGMPLLPLLTYLRDEQGTSI